MSEKSLKYIMIRTISVLLAGWFWYRVSDFRIDYGIIKNNTTIITLTIIWFIRVPIGFRMLWNEFEEILLDEDNNIIISKEKLMIYILAVLLVTCVTLWIMIWWKAVN